MGVKLPDPATALGARPTPRPSTAVASYNVQDTTSVGHIIAQSGNAIGEAGRILDRTGDEIFARQKVEQEKQDTVRAEDAFTKLRERQLDLTVGEQNGFQQVKGGAADNKLLTEWQKRFQDASTEIEGTLQNDDQKQKFRTRAQATGIQFQHELLNHIAKESDVFAKESYEGGLKIEQRNAAARWQDPEAVDFSLTRTDALVAERARQQNWPKEFAEAIRLQETGKVHSAIVGQAIAAGDWQYAQKWYEANKADIDPTTAKQLEVAVRDGTQKQVTAGYTSDLLANRDDRKGLDGLEKRITADETLDDTRKNALLGRVMSRGETLDRRAEAQQARVVKQVQRSIDQVNSNTRAGFEPSIEQMMPILNAAKGTELEADAQRMVQLANSTRAFRLAPPQQQESAITRAETMIRQDPTKFDLQLLTSWKEIYGKQQDAIRTDPTTFAVRQGLIEASQPAAMPLDLTKPGALSEQLPARFALARGMADRYQAPFKPLTTEEKDVMVGLMRKGTVEQKREHFGALARSSGGDMDGYRAMMAQIAPDDPVSAHGGVMAGRGYQTQDGAISAGRGAYVADLIFRGQALMSPDKKEDGKPTHGKSWPMPAGADEKTMLSTFESEEKGSLAGLGTGRENYIQTARAIYASLSEDARDATGVLNNSRWKQSITLATGGFSDVGGKRVILPYGYSEAQFKDGLSARIEAYSDRLPDTVTAKKLRDLPLQMAGDGRYVFRSGDSIILDKDNHPIVIDFNQSLPYRPSGSDIDPKSVPVAPMGGKVRGEKVRNPKPADLIDSGMNGVRG